LAGSLGFKARATEGKPIVITEADTCRKYLLPKLSEARWDEAPHSITEQKTFTDGRIVVAGSKCKRRPQKRADYLLRYRPDLMIAVVEAKAAYKSAGDGLQQAKEYAEILDLKFAYASNGHEIVEFDFMTGLERELDVFPEPEELWNRLLEGEAVDAKVADRLTTPFYGFPGYEPRYYQEIAVNRAMEGILGGRDRVLLTMATGTGKTIVAFRLCWKLSKGKWNRSGEHRRPRILYLADRNILVDDPKDRAFAPFGDARTRISSGAITKSREVYFATYQALAGDDMTPGVYREFSPDFFDLIVVDEAHRGSAREETAWRQILEYFDSACQLGMTATPLRDDTRDTYKYFGNPVYTYSLRQGIEDGFLAPYKVRRIVTSADATGWRPRAGEIDREGRIVPDDLYQTPDFERVVSLKARTSAIAQNLVSFMETDGAFGKTIVFCVDQEHADQMRRAINNAAAGIVAENPSYVVRVTADERDVGRGLLEQFQDVESSVPVIVTTSRLLTTGVDVPTCRNVVIARTIGTMPEFKQIIGRGTRVRPDYGKLFFNILDYTGSATSLFADPDFDGDPALISEEEMSEIGETLAVNEPAEPEPLEGSDQPVGQASLANDDEGEPRKYYVDGGPVEISAEVVYELGIDGSRLRVLKYADYAAETVRTLYPSAVELRRGWADSDLRSSIIQSLEARGIDFEQLAAATDNQNADPFDLLCNLAFSAPLRSRRERVDAVRSKEREFLGGFSVEAREVLDELLEKYAEYGLAQFTMPDVLKVPPISDRGNVAEIVRAFGGAEQMQHAVAELQTRLYVDTDALAS
jgi:type I restriction enzyme R subunit